MKKRHIILLTVGMVLTLIAGKLIFNFIINESLIKHTSEGGLDWTDHLIIYTGNFFEPYVAHYNNGNVYYGRGEYERAIDEYERALKGWPPKMKECRLRTNLVLAMLNRYDWSGDIVMDADALLLDLKRGRSILLEDGCATDNNDGHDTDAQTLKNDIDRLISELENQSFKEGGDSESPQKPMQGELEKAQEVKPTEEPSKEPSPDEANSDREQEIIKQLEEYKEESQKQRDEALEHDMEAYGSSFNFSFDDKIW